MIAGEYTLLVARGGGAWLLVSTRYWWLEGAEHDCW